MLMPLCQAIAHEEGFYAPSRFKTRAQRNNNPGDIEFGHFALQHGAAFGDPRFAVFKDPAAGFACLKALLTASYLGMSLTTAINKFAPSTENNTKLYINNICGWTGLTPDTILTEEML